MNTSSLVPFLVIVVIMVVVAFFFAWFKFGRLRMRSANLKDSNMNILDKMRILAETIQALKIRLDNLESKFETVNVGSTGRNKIMPGNIKRAQKPIPVIELKTSPDQLAEDRASGDLLMSEGHNSNSQLEAVVKADKPADKPIENKYDAEKVKDQIIEILKKQPMKTGEIAKALNIAPQKIAKIMGRLVDDEIVGKTKNDKWKLFIS